MEKAADNIQNLLKEKLACYQQLHLVLKAEKKAIGTIDLGMIWETTRAKKDLAGKIETLRNNILASCQSHFPGMDKKLGKKTDSFSLGALVHALPLPNKCKNDLRQLKRTIDKEKDIVAHFIKSNEIQIKKHLSVVDNIMDVIGNNVAQARYTGKGMMPQTRKPNCLFMAQV
ncbi:flagellar export chaperone FlgN [Desulfobacter curvatus]|uniref:flagellar export chaperone FlgN n=1 Tax=Desulfobacter curvatus TaxID=2290 RepID=UPI00035E449B|nr:flagellar export chaperone FlgN [Desulfobacter curvatus]